MMCKYGSNKWSHKMSDKSVQCLKLHALIEVNKYRCNISFFVNGFRIPNHVPDFPDFTFKATNYNFDVCIFIKTHVFVFSLFFLCFFSFQ